MVETVQALEETQPLFVSVSDIPCIDTGIITDIHDAYRRSGKDACSTWVPTRIVRACRGGMTYRETIKNEEVCPTGLNILKGDRIADVQDELQLVIADPRLALNVNTREDRATAEAFLNEHSGKP
jgi:adenosylcobinamide-phosphate guanylyltransferase